MENKNTNQDTAKRSEAELGRKQAGAQRPSEGSRSGASITRDADISKDRDFANREGLDDMSARSEGRDEERDESLSADSDTESDDFSTDSPVRGRPAQDTMNPQAKSEKTWQDKSH